MPVSTTRGRWRFALWMFLCIWLLSGPYALAEETPQEGLAVTVGLSAGSGAGISLDLELAGAEPGDPGSRAPIRTLRVDGPIGSLDLSGVPTCRPTTTSARVSGCTTPLVGKASGFAWENPADSESGMALKLQGTFRLYSGGQDGRVSKLYLWASYPGVGHDAEGRTLVVPITYTKEGAGRSELVARFPRTEDDLLDIALLRLSINRSIKVGGRPVAVTKVGCPLSHAAKSSASATFWGPREAVDATPSLLCNG